MALVIGCSVRFAAMRSRAGSSAATATSQNSSHPSATVPRRHADDHERQAGQALLGHPRRVRPAFLQGDRHGAGALGVDVAAQLGEERLGAQEFEDVQTLPCGMHDPRVDRWAASGAMALTGTPEEPLGPPGPLVDGLERLARPVRRLGHGGSAR